jgi:hypothetical protein
MGKKPKRKNQRPPGTCVFCKRSPPDIKMSQEHIWSDWLQDILPDFGARTEQYTPDLENEPHSSISKQGSVGTKKVKAVCEQCNNEWMSKIVNDAKPIARKLVLGEAVELNLDAQKKIVDWVALAALMALRITKDRHRFPEADLAYFYENRSAPPHWFVGIGYFNGLPSLCSNHSPLPLYELNEEHRKNHLLS